MDEVEKFYFRKSRVGQKPSLSELVEFCRRRKIRWTRSQLRGLKSKWMFTAIFAKPRRPQKYMSAAIQRYGILFVDLANYSGVERADAKKLGRRRPWDDKPKKKKSSVPTCESRLWLVFCSMFSRGS